MANALSFALLLLLATLCSTSDGMYYPKTTTTPCPTPKPTTTTTTYPPPPTKPTTTYSPPPTKPTTTTTPKPYTTSTTPCPTTPKPTTAYYEPEMLPGTVTRAKPLVRRVGKRPDSTKFGSVCRWTWHNCLDLCLSLGYPTGGCDRWHECYCWFRDAPSVVRPN